MGALIFDRLKTYGKSRVYMHGSFRPTGSSTPVVKDGKGFTVARISTGLYRVTFARKFNELTEAGVSLRVADATPTVCQFGDYSAANKTLDIRTFQGASAAAATKQMFTDLLSCRPTVRSKVMQLRYPRLGATPPTQNTTRNGLAFDADAETIDWSVRVPTDWDGASNITLRLRWHNEAGSAIPDTKKVKWNATINSVATGELVDAGTEQTPTATYTQSGAGVDKALQQTDLTIVYNDAGQPLASGDMLHITLNRDVTGEAGDTYAGDAVLLYAELIYQEAFPTLIPVDSVGDGPYISRVNGATDPTMRIVWPAGDVTPIQLPPFKLPDDLNEAAAINVRIQAKSSGATDTPTLTVGAYEGIGDTNFGGATGALSSSLAEVNRALGAGDIAGGTMLNVVLTPGTHGTDAVEVYSIALEYTCGDTTSVSMALADLADDADNVINFHAMFRDTSVAF